MNSSFSHVAPAHARVSCSGAIRSGTGASGLRDGRGLR